MIYANHAGTSWPKAPGVAEAVAEALGAAPGSSGRPLEAVAERLCRFLGIPSPERFVFTPGCTSALSTVMADLPWEAGDVLITSALEHHALARPVELLARDRGIVAVRGPYRPGRPIDLDFVRDTLRAGRVRLIAVTAASNVTGEVLPLAELATLAHEHGAWILADLAQVAGIVQVDLEALGIDLAVVAGHKSLLAPQGVGGFWASPAVRFNSPWASCEIGEIGERATCSDFPGYCDVGGANAAGIAGLDASLSWLEAADPWKRAAAAREQASQLRTMLGERLGCTVYGGQGSDPHTATVSFRDSTLPLDQAEALLRERGVIVRAGQHCAPWALDAIGAPEGTVRVSFGVSNAPGDSNAVLEALPPVG